MRVAKDTVVSIDFSLWDSEGELLDGTDGLEPVAYLHGYGNIVPGLEEVLEGKSEGEQLSVTVPPEKGFGERSEDLVQTVPRSVFPDDDSPKPGLQFEAETQAGVTTITVTAVEGDEVTIDANPPLAGLELHVEATVTGVRPATEAEIEAGQALDESRQ